MNFSVSAVIPAAVKNAVFIVAVFAAGCSKSPDSLDERCERIGRQARLSSDSHDLKFFDKECICLSRKVGCGYPNSKRFDVRMAAYRARQPRALTPEEKQKAEPLLSNFRVNADDMTEWTWYSDPADEEDKVVTVVKFYFGKKRGSATVGPLRLQVRLSGYTPVESLIIRVNERLLELPTDRSAWKLGYDSEVLDMIISDDYPDVAKALGTAQSVKIRLVGARGYDFDVSKEQVGALSRVYAAWEANAGVRL